MKRKIGALCLLLVLMVVNVIPVSAKENKGEKYIEANLEEMCPEEIALREKLGISADTPQVLSSEAITTGTLLSINSSGYAMCGGSVTGGDDIRTIQIFLYLQKNSTKENVISWMDVDEDYVFGMTRYHQLAAKGTYIVKMSAYVYTMDGNYKNLVRYSHTDTY